MKTNEQDAALQQFRLLAMDSEDALVRIITAYERPITLFATTILNDHQQAREVFHFTMEKAWTNRKKLAGLNNPVAWLFLVAKHKAFNLRRKNFHLPLVGLDMVREKLLTPDPIHAIEAKDFANLVSAALHILPPGERAVFVMSIQLGWEDVRIAAELGLAESTIRTQRSNALKKMRGYFRDWFT